MANELMNSNLVSHCSGIQLGPENPKWFSENLEGVNQGVKRMLEIIGQLEDSSEEEREIYYRKGPELISLIQEINHRHQFLSEQYDHLVEELQCNVSPAIQIKKSGSSVCHTCQGNPYVTPDQKLGMHKIEQHAIAFDLPISSGGSNSSSVSAKEGFESSSSSSSDLESYNSSLHNHSNSKLRNYEEMPSNLEIANDDVPKLTENKDYCGELRILKQKLRFSEDEIATLKSELEIKTLVAVDDLKAELEEVAADANARKDDLESEKRKVLELQMQLLESETKVVDSGCKIEALLKELKSTTEKLDISEGKLAKLTQDISNEISQSTLELQSELQLSERDKALMNATLASEKMRILELEGRITRYIEDVADRDCEISKLTTASQESMRISEVEKAHLQCHNSSLLEKLTLLEAKCAEREVQIKLLENEIKRCEASEMEMKGMYEAQEIKWQGDIEGLKARLNEQAAEVEILNKSHDGLKLKYDMLMAEKDGLIAKIHTLTAQLCDRDIKIQELEAKLHHLKLQHVDISAVSESSLKQRDDLRLKVEELEKEVERQAAVISDRAEEKREAIRQLCFSLEHYRSGYQELREAYIGQRRHAVTAA